MCSVLGFRGCPRDFVISLGIGFTRGSWYTSIAKGCHHQIHVPSTCYDRFYLFSWCWMDANLLKHVKPSKYQVYYNTSNLRRVGRMEIDYPKVQNELNFFEQLKLMKVVDKVSNWSNDFPGFKLDYVSSSTSYWILNYF